ncbi:MAG: sulfotransferase family 2 domain-containing protein [Parvibaculum sp.]|nr:sulfotransferase family 2 domain-containing protein [Parvibaculum sp.]
MKDPNAVFIHIPKNGGSSVKHGIWGSRYEGPVFGEVPLEWQEYFSFAFVRHPIERCMSAYFDFKKIRRQWFLSTNRFVDIVCDDSIGYGLKNTREKIRHHTLPQTHPYNCLKYAKFIGRYERFADDLKIVFEKLEMDVSEIPHMRASKKADWKTVFSDKHIQRLTEFYAEDFERLGYERP